MITAECRENLERLLTKEIRYGDYNVEQLWLHGLVDQIIALFEQPTQRDQQADTSVTWTCRFHPTDWFHEVGCPHVEWTKEQLVSALITKKKFAESQLQRGILGEQPVEQGETFKCWNCGAVGRNPGKQERRKDSRRDSLIDRREPSGTKEER